MKSFIPVRRLNSLRSKIFIWALVFIVPLFILLLINTNHATSSYKEQMSSNVQRVIEPFAREIDVTLDSAIRYVGSKEIDLAGFSQGSSTDELTRLNMLKSIGDGIAKEITLLPLIDSIFLYEQGSIHFIMNYNCDYSQNATAASVLENILNQQNLTANLYQQGFRFFTVNNQYYIYFASNVKGGVFGVWFSASKLLDNIYNAGIDGLSVIMFADHTGRILNSDFYNPSSKKQAALLSSYFVVQERLSVAPFTLIALMEKNEVFKPLNKLIDSMYIILLSAALLIIFYFAFLQNSVNRPLYRLIKSIEQIKKGDFQPISIQKNEVAEIRNVYEALNAMTSELESLKIKVYEEKLIKQTTQMQLFQLQLRPHLFLNALNTILSFARSEQYPMIQKMIICLADHCRYILYNNWYVSVEEELMYTQNYLNMLAMQHNAKYHYSVQVEDSLLDCEIPILGIQIFVENALKHSWEAMDNIWISVSVSKTEHNGIPCLSILIDDTGSGFNSETLEELNSFDENMPRKKDDRIGIINIRQRLILLYDRKASITFSNNEKGGAHIEMYLPTERIQSADVK